MHLNEYQWSHNPRGMHNAGAPAFINIGQLTATQMGWCKMVCVDREGIPAIGPLLGNNITPIIRIPRPQWGAGVPAADLYFAWQEYYKAGARWFELYNEPNFDVEWPIGFSPSYMDLTGTIAPLMLNWMDWAERIIEMGGYPAFPALGEHAGGAADMSLFLGALLQYAADNYYDRFRAIADSGMWVATHPYIYNHFYQEASGLLVPRAPEQESADQGGWHFEYPYDPVTQADEPGITVVSGPPKFPNGDPLGLTGMGHAFMERFGDLFGGGAVPVIGTEGGITPLPTPGVTGQTDNRFPGVTWNSHAEATLALFNWIAQEGPPWMFGVTLWKQDDYFADPNGVPPVISRLQGAAPIYKNVPAIGALDGSGPGHKVILPGPGPIHGTPDYHFLILAPGFDSNWFFSQAHDYWSQFRPALLSSTDYIAYVPTSKSLATTVLATPDLVDYMSHHIKERWPNVYFDLIVADTVEKVSEILAQRATSGRRFG